MHFANQTFNKKSLICSFSIHLLLIFLTLLNYYLQNKVVFRDYKSINVELFNSFDLEKETIGKYEKNLPYVKNIEHEMLLSKPKPVENFPKTEKKKKKKLFQSLRSEKNIGKRK